MTEDFMAIVPTRQIGGLRIAVLDRPATARLTIDAALARRGQQRPCLMFSTANGQGISMCAARPEVRETFDKLDLISADGMSVVFASRLLTRPGLPERVATTDAFHDAAEVAQREGASFYFLGARPDKLELAIQRVRQLYPRLKIVGYRDGYFSREQEHDIVEAINRAEPDVLWVGLGVPRQQEFLVRNRDALTRVGVAKTCGGLFDFLSGVSKRAPQWLQSMGLEWSYRMLRDPLRLMPRYLVTNPHALFVMATKSRRTSAPFKLV